MSTTEARLLKLYREITVPLFTSALLALIPGYMIARYERVWERVPALLIAVPALIGMRGNVFGSFASRLSTELQTKKNSARSVTQMIAFFDRYILFEVLLLSLAVALLSRGVYGAAANLRELLFNNLLNALVSGSIMLVCTKAVVRGAVRVGANPDNIAPIVVTSLGDTITIPCIVAIVTLLLDHTSPAVQYVVIAVLLAAMVALLVSQRHRGALLARVAVQRVPVLFVCMIGSFFSGMVMERMQSSAGSMQRFLVLVPLMNSQGGSIGSCVSSRLSTLQEQRSERHPKKSDGHAPAAPRGVDRRRSGGAVAFGSGGSADDDDDAVELRAGDTDLTFLLLTQTATLTACACTVLFVVCGTLFGYLFDSYLHMIYVMTLMAIILTTSSTAIALLAISASKRLGLDADNVTVPVVCALMDSIASISFFALVGVGEGRVQ